MSSCLAFCLENPFFNESLNIFSVINIKLILKICSTNNICYSLSSLSRSIAVQYRKYFITLKYFCRHWCIVKASVTLYLTRIYDEWLHEEEWCHRINAVTEIVTIYEETFSFNFILLKSFLCSDDCNTAFHFLYTSK